MTPLYLPRSNQSAIGLDTADGSGDPTTIARENRRFTLVKGT